MKVYGIDMNIPGNDINLLMNEKLVKIFKKNHIVGIAPRTDKMSQIALFPTQVDRNKAYSELQKYGLNVILIMNEGEINE